MKSFPLLLLIALVAAAPLAAPNPFRPRLPPRPPSTPLPPPPPPPPPVARARSSSPGTGGAPPEECFSDLFYNLFSCLDFLTNGAVMRPTALCCDGFRSILNSSAITCLCHVLSSEIDQYTHRPPINLFRAVLLPVECSVVPPLRFFTMCVVERVPPIRVHPPHPAPPPSPPVSSSGGGHA